VGLDLPTVCLDDRPANRQSHAHSICLSAVEGLENLDRIHRHQISSCIGNTDRQLPIIFLTGFGNIPMTVKAVKAGAVEFLTKPVEPDLMMEAIRSALDVDRLRVQISAQESDWRRRYQALTPRETEVLGYVIGGLMNKQLAAELGTSEITAKVHKRHIMEKMGARSPADLVRIAERLKLTATKTR
jgi:FixJ family two-component response regulator